MHANKRKTRHNGNIGERAREKMERTEEILHRPDPNSRTEISEADTNLEINTDEPSKIRNNRIYQEFKEQ